MSSTWSGPAAGHLRRNGTGHAPPLERARIPLVIPDPLDIPRWPMLVLTAALLAAGAALAAETARTHFAAETAAPRFTDEVRPVVITVGAEELAVPANMIADAGQRRGGSQERLDLTLHWPTLDGYNASNASLFARNDARLLQAWIAPGPGVFDPASGTAQTATRSGELDGLMEEIRPVAGGLFARAFAATSPYAGEEIAYEAAAIADGGLPRFAARCEISKEEAATCLRRVALAGGLTLTYRFPRALLTEWGRLDRRVVGLVEGLRSGPASNAGRS